MLSGLYLENTFQLYVIIQSEHHCAFIVQLRYNSLRFAMILLNGTTAKLILFRFYYIIHHMITLLNYNSTQFVFLPLLVLHDLLLKSMLNKMSFSFILVSYDAHLITDVGLNPLLSV